MSPESEDEKEMLPPVPRDMRTPISDAGTVVMRLAGVFQEIRKHVDGSDDGDDLYIEKIFGTMFNEEEANGDEQQAHLVEDMEKDPEEAVKFALIHAILIATAYAIQAMKSANASKKALHCPDAWRYAADARYWEGIVIATWGLKKDMPISVSDLGRRGAEARHAKNRAHKEAVIAAYQSGNFKSKDQAAEAIAGDVVPLSFRAVRDYLKGL